MVVTEAVEKKYCGYWLTSWLGLLDIDIQCIIGDVVQSMILHATPYCPAAYATFLQR
jgi:hypothetical protein